MYNSTRCVSITAITNAFIIYLVVVPLILLGAVVVDYLLDDILQLLINYV